MTTSGLATLVQVLILKQAPVRRYFNLPLVDANVKPKEGGMLQVRPLSLTVAVKQLRLSKPEPKVK